MPLSYAAYSFIGGLALPAEKDQQTSRPLGEFPNPVRVRIPVRQHRGNPAIPCVNVGDTVSEGQCIAKASGSLSANIHASISGTVTGMEQFAVAHESGLDELCIEIEAQGEQAPDFSYRVNGDYHSEDPNVLRNRVAEAGIVGLGGAAFPTSVKLSAEADSHLQTLVLNGAECEPYISCDEMLMRTHAREILRGGQMMLHILQINSLIVALEDDSTDSVDAMKQAIDELDDDRIQLRLLKARYPEGGERQLIQALSGKQVPSGGLPVDIGFLCHNVATAFAIYDAFENGRALTRRVISVCGPAVNQPQNLWVPIGTLLSELIEYCGISDSGPGRIIIGGPMMGFTISGLEVPVDKSTNCVLILPEAQARPSESMPCIRCGDCAEVCPAGLLPQSLFAHTRSAKLETIQRYNLFDCIECGCCDYVCPSNIPLTSHFRYAKDELWMRTVRRKNSERARNRYEQREIRLAEQAEQLRQQRRQRKRQAKDPKNTQSEIQAAIERANARKKDQGEP